MFIRLTSTSGNDLTVNTDNIIYFKADRGNSAGSFTYLRMLDKTIIQIKETPYQIREKIDNAQKPLK